MQARNRTLLATALALICAPAFAQHGQGGTHGQAAAHAATPATRVQGSAHASGSQGAQPTRNDDWKDTQSQTSQDATDAMGDAAQAQGATHAQAHSEVVTRDVFGTLDADHDGRISATEAGTDTDFNGGFAAMDGDGDGFVSDAEYRTWAKANMDTSQGAEHAAAHSEVVTRDVFGTLDADHDGRISATEAGVDTGFNGSFSAMDSNGDGFVTDAEYRAHAKADMPRKP